MLHDNVCITKSNQSHTQLRFAKATYLNCLLTPCEKLTRAVGVVW